ncbi:MAG: molybdopterin oxidoreductase family protein [Deltaproteobacteria bacterium]|nr:MAG: molybdopterin oxidoreductase family protein [Deltaproteobacteria bacterium]
MPSSASTTTTFRTCPLCEATCGLKLTLEEGKVTRVEGDPDDVFSQGFLCPKGAVLHHLHNDPDWLRAPQIREGSTWREASWEEAWARVEEGFAPFLSSSNRNAIALYLGNPNVHNFSNSIYMRPLIKTLRSRNLFTASTVDQIPKHVSSGLMFGHPRIIPVPDLDRTDYLLILGANPMASNGSLCTAPDFPGRLKKILQRGGKVVVLDPRKTRTAKLASEHHFIQPGTDPLFLLAVAHTLFAEERISVENIAEHLAGLEQVKAWVEPFSPESVSERCGLSPDSIRHIARALSEASSAAVYGRIGTCTTPFGTLTSWLVDVVNVLTGNLDQPGGAMFPKSAHSRHRPNAAPGGRGFRTGRWSSRVSQKPEVMGELPVGILAEEIETAGEDQVRALITVAGNPVLSTPNGERLSRALKQLDFMVSVDPYRNETTQYADVILPPPTPLQHSHYDIAFYDLAVRNVANYSSATLPRDENQPCETDILLHLIRLFSGQDSSVPLSFVDDFIAMQLVQGEIGAEDSPLSGRDMDEILSALQPHRGAERVLDFLLRAGPYGDGFGANPDGLTLNKLMEAPHGIDLGPLQPRIPEVLATPSGKVELAPESMGEELTRLQEWHNKEAPSLQLIGRRHLRSNNSWLHNLSPLVRGKDRCTLLIHPNDAADHNISDGETVTVKARAGSLQVAVEVTDTMMPGVVSLPHGWGHNQAGASMQVASQHPGVNSNLLTDENQMDRPSGNAVLNGIPVTLQK